VRIGGANAPLQVDTVEATFSGQVQGGSRYSFDSYLRAGDDNLAATFNVPSFGIDTGGPAGSEMSVYADGGPGGDTLAVRTSGMGSAIVNGYFETFLQGGLQPDILTVDWGDLTGSGSFKVMAEGGDGTDFLLGSVVADSASTNTLDVSLHGSSKGNRFITGDTAYLSVLDIGGNAKLGPGGSALLDCGVQGPDWGGFFGNALHKALNCETGPR